MNKDKGAERTLTSTFCRCSRINNSKKTKRLFLSRIFLLSFSLFFLSGMALAANPTPQTVNDIFHVFSAGNMMGFMPVLVTIGLVTFLAGVVKFVGAGDNEEQKTAGRSVMVYGLVVLFVMIAMWGLIGLITKTFFDNDPVTPSFLPTLQ